MDLRQEASTKCSALLAQHSSSNHANKETNTGIPYFFRALPQVPRAPNQAHLQVILSADSVWRTNRALSPQPNPNNSQSLIHGIHNAYTRASFYGSPLNPSLTKSLVLKPARGRVSCNTLPLAHPTSMFDSPLQTLKNVKIVFP